MTQPGRPENYELDDTQIADLKEHFEKQSVSELKTALKQTIRDSEKDSGPYKNGGVPSNQNKVFNIIQSIIDKKTG